MKKIKYPRYTREQKLSCKLSDSEIKVIRYLREWKHFSVKKIAKRFKVSETVIYYWLLSSEQRKERNRKWYFDSGKFRDKENVHEIQCRSVKRKYQMMPRFREYVRQFDS